MHSFQVRQGAIFDHFSQYGHIDKIRIVDEVDLSPNQPIPSPSRRGRRVRASNNRASISHCHNSPASATNRRYALVTFAQERSSYKARMRKSHLIEGRNYWIRRAESCYQDRNNTAHPILVIDEEDDNDDDVEEVTEPMYSFLPQMPRLNDDCLLKIFSFLDVHTLADAADSSDHFNYLIRLQKRRRVTFRFPPTTQNSMERCLRTVGPNITHLSMDFCQPVTAPITRKLLSAQNRPLIVRIFQRIRHHIDRSKLTHLRIDSMIVTPAVFTCIKPLFSSLRSLKIQSLRCAEAEEEIEFPKICPHLTQLKLTGTILLDRSAEMSWPTLTKLSIKDNYNLRAQTMTNLLAKNPQLSELRISCGLYDNINFNNLIEDVLKYQVNPGLTKLTFEDKWNGRQLTTYHMKEELGQMHSLRKLNLCFRFNYITGDNIRTICQLEGLTHLTLRFNFNLNSKQVIRSIKRQHLISIARGLPNLESFRLQGFQPSEGAVIEFIRTAKNLRTLNIRGCMRPLNFEFHENLLQANPNVVIG